MSARSFTFPIILYEDLPARTAVRESLRRTEGAFRRLATILLGWQVVGVILSGAAIWVFAGLSGLLIQAAAERLWVLVPVVALLAGRAHAPGGGPLVRAGRDPLPAHPAALSRAERRTGGDGRESGRDGASAGRGRAIGARLRYGKIAGLASLGVFAALCFGVLQQLHVPGNVIVTAHKGFSSVAPENSLSAIRKAIEVGADFAEIDVQETADGEIVLNHDRDLMRVAGVARNGSAR